LLCGGGEGYEGNVKVVKGLGEGRGLVSTWVVTGPLKAHDLPGQGSHQDSLWVGGTTYLSFSAPGDGGCKNEKRVQKKFKADG